jgi:hypothetical protein
MYEVLPSTGVIVWNTIFGDLGENIGDFVGKRKMAKYF